jgi:hypothetical protein
LSDYEHEHEDKPLQTQHPLQLLDREPRWRRALAIGAVVAAIDTYWVVYMEVVWNQGYASILSLFFNVVCSLALLLAVNAALRRWRPKVALAAWELLIVYVMASLGTAVGAWVEYLMALLTYPYRYPADASWATRILPFLPRWLTVSDPGAVRDYFAGNSSLYRWEALRPWLAPLGCWGLCILALVWTTLCLCSLARRQWTEHERLAYPITQIPLLMTRPGGPVFRSGLFWLGFAVAATVNGVNAAHMLWPAVPEWPVKRQPWEWSGLARPLSALETGYYAWNPFLIGLEFFLPVDLLFSLWFFYGFARLQGVLFAAWGIEQPGMAAESVAPYAREQAFGSIIALLIFALWTARHSWREVWREALGPLPSVRARARARARARNRSLSESETKGRKSKTEHEHEHEHEGGSAPPTPDAQHPPEPLPTLVAARGALIGCGVVLCFMRSAGMPWWIALPFLGVYLAVIASLTRIRAQFGTPAAGLLLAAPTQVMVGALGTGAFGATGLHGAALFHWLGREMAGHPMPHQLEAFRLASSRGIAYRGVITAVMLGATVGLVTAFWGILHLSYTLGQGTAKVAGTQRYFGREAFTLLAARLGKAGPAPQPDAIAAILFGVALTWLLQAMRVRFPGWPFHPVGYALSSTYVSSFLWSTALVAWLFKLLLFRYSGLKGYQTVTPFFLGLILGEFVVGSLISLAGVLLNTRMYVFWPY